MKPIRERILIIVLMILTAIVKGLIALLRLLPKRRRSDD